METNGTTSADIEAQINAMAAETPQPSQASVQEQPVIATAPDAQPGKADKEVQLGQVLSDPSKTVAGQGETKPAEPQAIDALMAEKNVTDPNLIAKMYKDLQSDYTRKAQELAELRKRESVVQQQTQTQPQVNPLDSMNQQFVNDLAQNPLGTLSKLVDALAAEKVKPFEATRKEAVLNAKVVELSTSPDTGKTFNLKPVQDEIRKVYSENPAMLDNLPATLSLVHDIALGRLARKGFTVNAQIAPVQGQEPVPVEGRNKPTQTTLDIRKASSAELEAYINNLA